MNEVPPALFQKINDGGEVMGYSVKIRQHDMSDCGVACLASVSAFWGLKMPLARIRLMSNTDRKGTTIKGLVDAAKNMGFDAAGYSGRESSLYRAPKPAILHLEKKSGLLHFVVLYQIRNGFLKIMDPQDGEIHKVRMSELLEEWSGRLILLSPAATFRRENAAADITGRLFSIISENRRSIAKALILSLFFMLTAFGISLFMKIIFDKVIPSGNLDNLTIVSAVLCGVFCISFLLSWFRSVIMVRTGVKIDVSLIGNYIRHLTQLPALFYEGRETGEITSRVSDAFKIRNMITETLMGLVVSAVMLAGSAAAMFAISPGMAIRAVAIVPLFYIIFRIFDEFNKRIHRKIMEQGARFESSLIETIRSYATLKHSGAEHYFAGKSTAALNGLGSMLVKSGKTAAFTGGLADFISKIFTVFVLWAGGREMIAGTLTPGDLISFFTLISLFTSPLAEIVTSSSSLREGTVAAGRVFEIMDLEAEPLDTGVTAGTEAPESINFENVCFSYPGRATVLKNLNLSFRRGEITAITGESGSGKSTVVSLITRMRIPTGGMITADGVNISHINLRSWRGLIAVVPQSPGLFDGTITENIAPGEEEPDLGRIVEICSDLGILGFLQSMPMGFESRAGEGGSSLSRGQQQRIAVARALYRESSILVLDEATSSLDGESEALIEKAVIREKSRGKIVILISHKERNRTIADRIYSI